MSDDEAERDEMSDDEADRDEMSYKKKKIEMSDEDKFDMWKSIIANAKANNICDMLCTFSIPKVYQESICSPSQWMHVISKSLRRLK